MRDFCRFWIIGFLLWGFWAWPRAEATLLVSRSLEQQIRAADRILKGRVLRQRAFIYEGNGHIYTDVHLAVSEALKGHAPPVLVIRQLGGVVGERETRIAGSARFQVGEEVVVFLEVERAKGFLFVQDYAAGKYSLYEHNGESFLRRDLEGLAFYRHSSDAKARIQHPQLSEAPLALSTLRERIHALKDTLPTPRLLPVPAQQIQFLHHIGTKLQRSQPSQAIKPTVTGLPVLPSAAPRLFPIASPAPAALPQPLAPRKLPSILPLAKPQERNPSTQQGATR
jgi:hypothetical protein